MYALHCLCAKHVKILLLLIALLHLANTRTIRSSPRSSVVGCSQNMPCQWAVCPWTNRLPYDIPDDDNCVFIVNVSCRCHANQTCSLVPNMMEPMSAGMPLIKYEYQCAEKNKPRPSVTRDINHIEHSVH